MDLLDSITPERFFQLCVFGVILVAAVSLRKQNSKGSSRINFDDLLTDINGRMDPVRCMAMGTWLVMTLAFLKLALLGTPNEGMFAAYAATLIPLCAQLYTDRPQNPVSAVQVDKVELTASLAPKEP